MTFGSTAFGLEALGSAASDFAASGLAASFLTTGFFVLLSASWLVPWVCHSWLRATSGFSVVGSAAADDATINQLQELINKKHFNYYLVNLFRVFNKNRINLKLQTLLSSIAVFHGINVIFIVSMQCF